MYSRVFLEDVEDGSDSVRAGCREGTCVRGTMHVPVDLVIELQSVPTSHHPGTLLLRSPAFGRVTVSCSCRSESFLPYTTLAWIVTVFTEHYCIKVTTLTPITNMLYFIDFLKRRR